VAFWGRRYFLLITTADALPRWRGQIARLREQRRDEAGRAILDHELPQDKSIPMNLSEALEYIGTVTGAKMVIDWDALTAAGAAKDARVYVHASNILAGDALVVLLGQGGAGPEVEIAVEGGTVRIGRVKK
jgi:hypothetical protein